jgi:hypothetical protein
MSDYFKIWEIVKFGSRTERPISVMQVLGLFIIFVS